MTKNHKDGHAPEPKPSKSVPKRTATSASGNREEASEGRAKMVRGIIARNRKHGEE